MSARRRGGGLRLTERDLDVLRFVACHGFATAEQVGLSCFSGWGDGRLELGVSMTMVYRRLKKLVDADLLRHEYVLHGRPGVYLATRRSAELADAGVPPAKVDLKSFDHDLAVVDLALALEGQTDWITERQIRAKAVSAARGGGGRVSRAGGTGRTPDGLLVSPWGEVWAVELEISGKDNARYLDVFRGYVRRHRERIPEGAPETWPDERLAAYVGSGGEIDGVAWYFRSPSKRERARRAAEEAEAEDFRRSRHCRFFFGDASEPRWPPFEKWDEQREQDRRADLERRRAAHEERKYSHLSRVRLTEQEASYVLEEFHRRKNEGRLLPRRLTEEEEAWALREGLEMKREHERENYPEFWG
ncbi:MAG: hypothetical protein AVDCRST_MAG02-2907 [uncultured Rubrobacteraceae bacterium]|uniref:Replication-relaxation n=1 Tax=uncultured Rubrobacteraceae bacterium TaxID=349277 RepID=A0A6J4RAA1_9ACTN|nr:MAG: hypothetical protein AVDCRST_MAG02-2907 [uncultured Rubrobacteraceae bacterium]